MVQQNEEVNYQGRRGRVTSIMGDVPNQVVNIRFDDGSERIVSSNELEEAKGSGLSGSSLNQEQISRGQSGGGNVIPPAGSTQLPSNRPSNRPDDRPEMSRPSDKPKVDNTLPQQPRINVSEQTKSNREYQSGMRPDSRADVVEPPLEGGEPNPPLEETDETPNDAGPGTGDSGAGLKADGKDVDSQRRRLLGTEEIVIYIEPVTRKIVDRNGRKIEIGTVVNLKARIVKFHGADKAEVLYPPYVIQSGIPVFDQERQRLEIPNQDDLSKGNGTPYEGGQFSYKDGQIVDANGKPVQQPELEKQEKLQVKTKYIEKF